MKNEYAFSAYGFLIDGETIWFVPYYRNYLCCYSLKDDESVLCKRIPEDVDLVLSFANLLKYNNKVILIPDNANNMYIYDINKDEFDIIVLDSQGVIDKYYGYVLKQDVLYLFGAALDDIIKVNLIDKSTIHLDSWKDNFHGRKKMLFFQLDYLVTDDCVFLLSKNTDEILKMNLADDSFETIEISNEGVAFSTICQTEDGFFLTDEQGNGFVCNINFDICKKIIPSPKIDIKENKKTFALFMDSIYIDNRVIAFPGLCDSLFEFDLVGMESHIIESIQFDCLLGVWSGVETSMVQLIGNKIMGFKPSGGFFFEMDCVSGDIKKHYFKFKKLSRDDQIYELNRKKNVSIIYEGRCQEDVLNVFLEIV